MGFLVNNDMLLKYFSGKASPEEAMAIDEWRKASMSNESYFQELFSSWNEGNEYAEVDVARQWQEFSKRTQFVSNSTKKKFSWKWLPYAAILILALSAVFYWMLDNGSEKILAKYSYEVGKENVQLTKVNVAKLNPGATLSYIENDSAGKFYSLKGDASFNFQNKMPDFLLQLPHGLWLKDIGTQFEIKSNSEKLTITVTEGIVEVWNKNTKNQISKDQVLIFEPSRNAFEICYLKSSIDFKDMSFQEVIKSLNKTFNSKISLKDAKLAKRRITLKGDHMSLNEVLEIIAMTLDVNYEKNKDHSDEILFY